MQEMVWYHVISTMYGAWLPGDPRGFRTRHHREHIEGDYKNPPPPGKYSARHRYAKSLMTQAEVILPVDLRRVVGLAVKERLIDLEVQLIAISVSAQHAHLLGKMPVDEARRLAGLAKKHAWFELRDNHDWTGKLWGKRGKEVLVTSRQHQLNVYQYIMDHAEEGAWVWGWLMDKTHGPQPVGLQESQTERTCDGS